MKGGGAGAEQGQNRCRAGAEWGGAGAERGGGGKRAEQV